MFLMRKDLMIFRMNKNRNQQHKHLLQRLQHQHPLQRLQHQHRPHQPRLIHFCQKLKVHCPYCFLVLNVQKASVPFYCIQLNAGVITTVCMVFSILRRVRFWNFSTLLQDVAYLKIKSSVSPEVNENETNNYMIQVRL